MLTVAHLFSLIASGYACWRHRQWNSNSPVSNACKLLSSMANEPCVRFSPFICYLLIKLNLVVRSTDGLILADWRSEEHTSELQSLMRISYAVFCLKKKK